VGVCAVGVRAPPPQPQTPNPQSPIPNPQSPYEFLLNNIFLITKLIYLLKIY